jgi:hypothetical protein
MEPEIYEKRSLPYFLLPKKQLNSRSIFFSIFLLSGRPEPSKSSQITVDQKRGYHRFLEKRVLFKNTSKSDPPSDPRNRTKQKKHYRTPSENTLEKKIEKNTKTSSNPVSKQANGRPTVGQRVGQRQANGPAGPPQANGPAGPPPGIEGHGAAEN